MTVLRPLRAFCYPIEGKCIAPDNFANRTPKQIGSFATWEGNQQRRLGDLFEIFDDGQLDTLTIEGDVSRVRGMGTGMSQGQVVILGNAGMHLGEEMKGGKISVHGNVDSWAGSMMKGGEIEIHGNARDFLAAPYRGSTVGMRSGRITVYGDVGNEAGSHLKRGTVKIYGSAGQFVGFRMRGGTVYVQNGCGARAGACMTKGKLVVLGRLDSVLPSFTFDSLKDKVKIDENETVNESLYVFLGDRAEKGEGKLYVSKTRNPHLAVLDRFG